MLKKLFGRLFSRAGGAAPAAETPHKRVSIAAPAVRSSAPSAARVSIPTEIELSDSPTPVGVQTIDATPIVRPPDLEESEWQERFASTIATWRESAKSLKGSPDALALIDMLDGSSDFVIRQLPAAAREAIALCDDQSISRSRLSERLGQDPALVQAMLRAANNALISAGRQPVLRLDGALERIGMVAGRSVVLANCVDGLLSRPGAPYESMVNDVWAHMIRSGPLAKVIAPAFSIDGEEAFSVALLHDVGKLVVFDQISALRAKHRRAVSIPTAWLSELLQAVHEPLGALAAFRWSMGPRAAMGIGHHHRSDPDSVSSQLAEVVFAAERADHLTRRGEPLDLDDVWTAGRLSGSPFRAASAIGAHYRAA
ncbi:MAG: HDOD domain-containing protein [bacterium]